MGVRRWNRDINELFFMHRKSREEPALKSNLIVKAIYIYLDHFLCRVPLINAHVLHFLVFYCMYFGISRFYPYLSPSLCMPWRNAIIRVLAKQPWLLSNHQMETFSTLLAICAGNSPPPPSPVNSPHKGQWRGALMFSLICVCINNWVNNREAGDLIIAPIMTSLWWNGSMRILCYIHNRFKQH